jgi:hypothetical protein
MTSGDISRQLAVPLLVEAGTILSQHLPIMDVAQILSNEAGAADPANPNPANPNSASPSAENPNPADPQGADEAARDLGAQVRDYMDRAVPLLAGRLETQHNAFLLVPASAAGKALEHAIHQVFPDIRHVRVAGQSDLMLCREQGSLTAQDLHNLLKTCRTAYEHLAGAPSTSPHARFDILDWLPLDP